MSNQMNWDGVRVTIGGCLYQNCSGVWRTPSGPAHEDAAPLIEALIREQGAHEETKMLLEKFAEVGHYDCGKCFFCGEDDGQAHNVDCLVERSKRACQ